MEILQAIFLGIVQGLTEFIPVSSSGHLILAEKLFGLETGGLLFDVMLHSGTLLALMVYFRKDITKIIKDFFNGHKKVGWQIIIATVPAVIAGVLLQGLAENQFRSIGIVIFNLVFIGFVMLLADKRPQRKDVDMMSNKQAFNIGIAQSLALVPGVSRSGISISAARGYGFSRDSAARFAFLIAIPITLGAIIKLLLNANVAEITTNVNVLVVGVVSATVSGYLAIDFLIKYLKTRSLAVFSYYRFALAAVILIFTLVK